MVQPSGWCVWLLLQRGWQPAERGPPQQRCARRQSRCAQPLGLLDALQAHQNRGMHVPDRRLLGVLGILVLVGAKRE